MAEIDSLIGKLEEMEGQAEEMEGQLKAVYLELQFLKTFLTHTSKRGTARCENLKILFRIIDDLIHRAAMAVLTTYNESAAEILSRVLPNLIEGIELIKHEVRDVCIQVSNLSSSSSAAYAFNNAHMDVQELLQFNASLVNNLVGLLNIKSPEFTAPLKHQVILLVENVSFFLGNFLLYVEKSCDSCRIEKLEDFLRHIQSVCETAACISYLCLVDQMDGNEVKTLNVAFSNLMQTIAPITPQVREIYSGVLQASKSSRSVSNLLDFDAVMTFFACLLQKLEEILNHEAGSKASGPNHREELGNVLIFMVIFRNVMEKEWTKQEKFFKHLMAPYEALVIDAACVILSPFRTNLAVSDLLKGIGQIKLKAKKIYFERSSASITEEILVGFLDSLLGNLKDQMNCMPELFVPAKDAFEIVYADMTFFQNFIGELPDHKVLSDIISRVGGLAYQVADVIDSFVVGDFPVWYLHWRLSHVLEEINLIKTKINETYGNKIYHVGVSQNFHRISNYKEYLSAINSLLDILEEMEDQAETMKEKLNAVQLELQFLKTFLIHTTKQAIKYENLEILFKILDELILTAAAALSSNYKESLPQVLSRVLPGLLQGIELIKHEVRDLCFQFCNTPPPPPPLPMNIHELAQFITSLVNNLICLLKCKPKSTAPLKDQVIILVENLSFFLGNFLSYAENRCGQPKKLDDLVRHIQAVGSIATCISYLCLVDQMDGNETKKLNLAFSNLQQTIAPTTHEVREVYKGALIASKPSISDSNLLDFDAVVTFFTYLFQNLEDVLNHQDNLIVPMKKTQTETLGKVLIFLSSFLMVIEEEWPKQDKFKHLMIPYEALVVDAACVILSPSRTNLAVSDLQERIEQIKLSTRKIYFERSSASIEEDILVGFVDWLQRNLKEQMNCMPELFATAKDAVQIIQGELTFFRTFLGDIPEQCQENVELADLISRIKAVAYEAEYVIDSMVVGEFPVWYLRWRLTQVTEETNLIKTKITQIYEKKIYGVGVPQKVATIPGNEVLLPVTLSQANRSPLTDEVLVGLDKETATIKERLTARVPAHLEVISIVGMAGLGKTTLAKKVYNDPLIVDHFYIRAWCYVSQIYQKREMLLDILGCIDELTDQIYKMSDKKLSEKLYQKLKRSRFLIVMDDIWNIGAWRELERTFPNDNNGSRILFTTRLNDVAKIDRTPLFLRFLSEEESWDLLRKKVFQNETCPLEFLEVGMEIAKKCQRLPLSIVVIAGLLAKTEKVKDWWEQVAESLHSHIAGNPKQVMDTLELSYRHLPNHLKRCFLYCGAFPEDREIPVWKLKWLWTAEGFVHNTGQKNIEEAAEECLIELIGRSLVLISKRRSNGGVKSCYIHDLLRDLSLIKAKEENFQQIIKGHYHLSKPLMFEQRRLRIYAKREDFIAAELYGPHARSLLFFAFSDDWPRDRYDLSFIFSSFKLLRVLDLETINMGESIFADKITRLVHLRYLAVQIDMNKVPPSIAKLHNLETLIVKGIRGEVKIPETILGMIKLRHLRITSRASFSSPLSTVLESLETISKLCFSDYSMLPISHFFPNLRKMGCIISDSDSTLYKGRIQFLETDFLNHLESLKVSYYGHGQSSYLCSVPLNLKKLTLSKFRRPWEEISIIGRLPKLEILKLLFKAFEGSQWKTNDDEFINLKFLKLDSLDFEEWDTLPYHFPSLQRLAVQRCKHLKEIPSSLGDIPTLQMIELNWCSPFAADSVRQIQEDQLSNGNEGLNVRILQTVN